MAKRSSKTVPILPAVQPMDPTAQCDICTAGHFPAGVHWGECRAHPMQWTYDSDGSQVPSHSPASRTGWCREFIRKAH